MGRNRNPKVAGSSLRSGRNCRCGSKCPVLSPLNSSTEVIPLSKALNPQLLPGLPTAQGVCSRCVCVHCCVIHSMGDHISYLATCHITFFLLFYHSCTLHVDSDPILTYVTDRRGICSLPETKSSLRLRQCFVETLIEMCVGLSGEDQCLVLFG